MIFHIVASWYYSALYLPHLVVRLAHDRAYKRFTLYKNYTDKPISNAIHKATVVAFIISFVSFNALQYVVPYYLSAKPKPAEGTTIKLEDYDSKDFTYEKWEKARSQVKDIKDNGDGTYTGNVYSHPVQYKNGDQWRDIDTTIKYENNRVTTSAEAVSGERNKDLVVSEAPYTANFSSNPSKDLKFQYKDEYVLNSYIGTQKLQSSNIEANKITYVEAYQKTDIERIFKESEIKQNIILKAPGHPSEFKEKLESSMEIRLLENNMLGYFKNNVIIATAPPIIVIDSQGEKVNPELDLSDNILTIKIPDVRHLSYPLVIDPSTTIYATSGDDTYVAQTVSGYDYIYTSNPIAATGIINSTNHVFMRFSLAGINATNVSLATLNFKNITASGSTDIYHASSFNPGVDSGTSLWSVGHHALSNGVTSYTALAANTYKSVTVTTDVQDDINAYSPYTHFRFRDGSTQISLADTAGTTSDPYLSVTYTTPPLPPTNFTGTTLSTTSLKWDWTDASNNENGFRVQDAAHLNKATLSAGANTWTETGLSPNTAYTRHVHSYSSTLGESIPSPAVTNRYTLSPTPSVSETTSKTPNNWYNSNSYTFQNNLTWGTGGVGYYRYVWNTSPTYVFNDTETTWFSSTKTFAASDGNYYLHLKSYNSVNVGNSATTAYGPFKVDLVSPVGTVSIKNGALYINSLTSPLNLSANDSGSGAGQVRFSNNDIIYSAWENITWSGALPNFAAVKTGWDLSDPTYGGDNSETEKKVYAQIKDVAGNYSSSLKIVHTLDADFGGITTQTTVSSNSVGLTLLSAVPQVNTYTSQSQFNEVGSNKYNVDALNVSGGELKLSATPGDGSMSTGGELYTSTSSALWSPGVDIQQFYMTGSADCSCTDNIVYNQNNTLLTNVCSFGSDKWFTAPAGTTGIRTATGCGYTSDVPTVKVSLGGYLPWGTFISNTIDQGDQSGASKVTYTNFAYTADVSGAGTAVKFQLASNNDNATWNYVGPDGTANTFYTSSGQAIHTSHNSKRYLRVKSILTTTNRTFSPIVNSFSVNSTKDSYQLSGDYTSQSISLDAYSGTLGVPVNIKNISWTSNIPARTSYLGGTPLKYQIATNNDNTTWVFKGPDGNTNTYYTSSGASVWSGHIGQKYFKYKTFLATDDGSYTPRIDDITLDYTGYIYDFSTYDFTLPAHSGAILAKTDSLGTNIPASTWQNDNDPYFYWDVASDTSGIGKYYYSIDNPTPESGGALTGETTNAFVQLPADYIALDGQHIFYIRAEDAAGNKSSTVLSFNIYTESTAPTITYNQTALGDATWRKVNGGTFNVDFADGGSGVAGYKLKVTDAPLGAGNLLQDWYDIPVAGAPASYTLDWSIPELVWGAMVDGKNYVYVSSYDQMGNTRETPDYAFYVNKDTSGPVSDISYLNGLQGLSQINLTKVVVDVDSGTLDHDLEYQEVDLTFGTADFSGATWIEVGGTSAGDLLVDNFSSTTSRAYKFRLRAIDNIGNIGAYSEPAYFVGIDTTAPMATIDYNGGLNSTYNTTTINFSKTSGDNNSLLLDYDLEYSAAAINGGNPDFTGAVWHEVGGANGGDELTTNIVGLTGYAYRIRYRALNGAGLWGSGTADPGVVDAYSSPNNWVGVDTVNPSISAFGIQGAYIMSGDLNVVPGKSVSLSISATDADSSPSKMQFSYSGLNGEWGSVSDSITGDITFDDSWANYSQSLAWTIPEYEVERAIYLRIQDGAGNVSQAILRVILDSTNPINPVIVGYRDFGQTDIISSGTWYPYTHPYFNWTSLDGINGSGVKGYYMYFGLNDQDPIVGGSFLNCSLGGCQNYDINLADPIGVRPEGSYYLNIVSEDNVGRKSARMTYKYNYDKTSPDVVGGLSASGMLVTDAIRDTIDVSWYAYSIVLNQEAPIEYYEIERIKKQPYIDRNLAVTASSVWDNGEPVANQLEGYATFKFYQGDPEYINHNFEDSAVSITQGQFPVENGVVYLYRIRVKDVVDGVTSGPYQNYGPVYGQTLDTVRPNVSPSGLHVGVCTSALPQNCTDSANVGFETKITWDNAAGDLGTGIGVYVIYRSEDNSAIDSSPPHWIPVGFVDRRTNPANPFVWYDNDANNLLTLTGYKDSASASVDDYVNYYYRVTAFDKAGNESEFFARDIDNNDINQKAAPQRTPDVTSPPASRNLQAQALGLDGSDTNYNDPTNYPEDIINYPSWKSWNVGYQKVRVGWIQDPDISRSGNHSGSGIGAIRLYRSFDVNGPFVDVTDDTRQPVTCDINTYSCTQIHLVDITTFYYKVIVSDLSTPAQNISNISDASNAIRTANSAAPTPPQNVTVTARTGDPENNPGVGKIIDGTFTGSYAKGCLNQLSCIVAYEIYRSNENYTNPEDWYGGVGHPALATRLPDISVTPVKEERGFLRSFVDEGQTFNNPNNKPGLDDATRYYYVVRARDNGIADGNLYSILSSIDETTPGLLHKGWDITADITKPIIQESGLEVIVKNTHQTAEKSRNIVSWKTPVTYPTRKKLGYETCEALPSDASYCKDFSGYAVYRQVLNEDGTVKIDFPEPIEVISDYNTNYHIDELDNTLDVVLVTGKLRYSVKVVDNAKNGFKYPNSAVPVNDFNNYTIRYLAMDTIIPNKSTPVFSGGVQINNVGVSSATIAWNTDQDTDGVVEFRIKDSNSNYTVIGENTSPIQRVTTQLHEVKLFGLKPSTEYEYRVVSKNYLGNIIVKGGQDVPVLKTSGFFVTFSNSITTTSTAEISWSTNLNASSAFIEYQLNKTPGDDPQGGTAGVEPGILATNPTAHKVVVKGLRSNRTYTYKIKSISTDGFITESEFLSFRTKNFDSDQFTIAPSSSNIAERQITSTTAQIVWQTSTPSTSWVDYGTTSGKFDVSSGNDSLTEQHVVVLEGLVPGTTYFYRVRSKDNNELEYTSQEYSFKAILKPKISNMKLKDVTPYTVTISWDTNVDTETIINWGKTAGYGEKKGISGVSKVHEIKVENLEDNQEYHYQILAKDETGNEVADEDKIIRTPLDKEGPKIEGVKLDVLPMGESETTGQVIISWTTNKPATTLVEYDEGVIGGNYSKQSIEDNSLNTSHTVIVKDLKPATSYHYRIVSKDKRSNTSVSQDYTFVTPTKEKSILQLIIKSLEETFSWTRNLNQFFSGVGKRFTGR